MLKNSAAPRASRSVRQASMFCTTYPPPPGSEPGYHDAHQFSVSSAASVMAGTTQTPSPLGQNDITAAEVPNVVPGGVPAGCMKPSFAFSTFTPPTALNATTARMIAPPISNKYCTPCVVATPQ